ncbi:hypothetical protein MSNKSG1_04376 [Marinobacter santoriniensis NKSG1]|uniref:Copper chaperone PCu(A)C n=1 Tax=Marinobacter santoriniensis NKSG1 TaxID=1288826 RepID=M7CWD3_9GAMM|nr:copper chaperone PCu(A)C [Marinobacter santoriniensis]EMP56540.1 hypothetical protein MSNKSG1_04376 [Marinobacter santoriniensis NKSG1]
MYPFFRSLLVGVSALLLSTGLAFASDVAVSNPKVRLMPGDIPSAGYFKLHNGTNETIKLVGARSDAFGMVHMHMSMKKDGMAHMKAVPEIDVAAGEDFEFAPSGYHLMLMKRSAPLKVGDDVVITLEFEGRDPMPVSFKVVSPAAM